ncbi:coat protein [Taro-associated totivirus L]|nr:coat protein [Taro-associated totivirus L]
MDSFVRRFFPDFHAPGAPFIFDDRPRTFTFLGGILYVDDGHGKQNRPLTSSQAMTPLGLMRATVEGGASSIDGLTKNFVTPEGTVNITSLGDYLKTSAGLQTAMLSAHVGTMQHWSWADNHVALLVNMLRYTIIRRIQEAAVAPAGKLGIYDDGHVSIDLDQWWPKEYPEAAELNDWPGGDSDDNYPTYVRLNTSVPNSGHSAVDLRNLTQSEARFVLLMLGSWKRTTRYRLDFETERLTDHVLYRYERDVSKLDSWLTGEGQDKKDKPAMMSWNEAWGALRAYVTQNRLFDHFSVALYIISAATYQFYPSTAEGTYWLTMPWQLTMPRFTSIRGRYECLNEGEAALVSHRALSEWGYINGKLEKINLMALAYSQAYFTGIAVRCVRRGLEMDPQDLYNSEASFYSAINTVPAAAAEAVRFETPMAGMSGVYLSVPYRFEMHDDNRHVLTRNKEGEEVDGYDLRKGGHEEVEMEMREVTLDELVGRSAEDIAQASNELEIHRATAAAKVAIDGKYPLTEAEERAVRGKVLMKMKAKTKTRFLDLHLPWLTFAGLPTLIMPLDPFPYNSPLTLKGRIDSNIGHLQRRGHKMSLHNAWLVANLYRLCGYDLLFRSEGEVAGAGNFFAPNNVHFTWPMLGEIDQQEDPVTCYGQEEREHHFAVLPTIYTKIFTGHHLDYALTINRKGVASSALYGRMDIAEYGGPVMIAKVATVSYNVPEGVARLRGYITRDDQGFRYVQPAQAGVMPESPEVAGVPAVEGQPGDGGIRL